MRDLKVFMLGAALTMGAVILGAAALKRPMQAGTPPPVEREDRDASHRPAREAAKELECLKKQWNNWMNYTGAAQPDRRAMDGED